MPPCLLSRVADVRGRDKSRPYCHAGGVARRLSLPKPRRAIRSDGLGDQSIC
ncbi:MAG: hypothetical protein IKI28_06765 [Bacteroidales bacterium]|nr:hypothetical protein [Bacteroidales bacterium]